MKSVKLAHREFCHNFCEARLTRRTLLTRKPESDSADSQTSYNTLSRSVGLSLPASFKLSSHCSWEPEVGTDNLWAIGKRQTFVLTSVLQITVVNLIMKNSILCFSLSFGLPSNSAFFWVQVPSKSKLRGSLSRPELR